MIQKPAVMNVRVGDVTYSVPEQTGLATAIRELIVREEKRVLALKNCGMSTDEDLLILFVRMYILRWAMPAVEIESATRLGPEHLKLIERRFWLCMVGRALDDLKDQDSVFFSVGDSAILMACYSSLLDLQPEKNSETLRRVIASTTTQSTPEITAPLTMSQIEEDVCRRVNYFLSPGNVDESRASLLRRYIGVLLGRCDLDDCLADGRSGPASTTISKNLYETLADREGKVHICADLLNWYKSVHSLLSAEGQALVSDLSLSGACYAAEIVASSVARWDHELKQMFSQS